MAFRGKKGTFLVSRENPGKNQAKWPICDTPPIFRNWDEISLNLASRTAKK
jgi:hypothetical protein